MSVSKFLIYGLVDPVSGQLRYVGKSTEGLDRPKEHGYPSELKRGHGYKENWIRQLRSLGLNYKIEVLHEVTDAEILSEAEIHWIAYFRALGCKLTNLTDGGEGCLGRIRSNEEKQRIRLSNMETKRKISIEQEAELCKLYLQEMDTYQLAKKFKIDRHTVVRWLKKNGVAIRNKKAGEVRRKIPLFEVQAIIAKYLAGATMEIIAREYNTYSSNICNLLKKNGVATRPQGSMPFGVYG